MGKLCLCADFLLSIFYPQRCVACEEPASEGLGQFLCVACSARVRVAKPPHCPRCGRPYPGNQEDHLCGDCQAGEFALDRARFWACYAGEEEPNPLREAIYLFKYHRRVGLAKPFGVSMAEVARTNGLDCDWIIPVPLSAERLRWRGFNQALLLAKRVGRELFVPVDPFSLVRVRNTQPQVELRAAERKRNVRDAFAVVDDRNITGKKVLLVDDLYTSGATAGECAKILKQCEAAEVNVLTLARVM